MSLPEALTDPAYAIPDTFISQFGPMWGHRRAKEKQVTVDGRSEPEPPSWIGQYVEEHRIPYRPEIVSLPVRWVPRKAS